MNPETRGVKMQIFRPWSTNGEASSRHSLLSKHPRESKLCQTRSPTGNGPREWIHDPKRWGHVGGCADDVHNRIQNPLMVHHIQQVQQWYLLQMLQLWRHTHTAHITAEGKAGTNVYLNLAAGVNRFEQLTPTVPSNPSDYPSLAVDVSRGSCVSPFSNDELSATETIYVDANSRRSRDSDVSSTSSHGLAEPRSICLPSATEGEPLDIIPKSMYMNKIPGGHLCVFCGKCYSRKYGLKIHLRTHTGYKPLKCKVCLRPFGDPSNLNKHVRLHADGETPYRCIHCGKVLVRRRDLDRHIRSRHFGLSASPAANDMGDASSDDDLMQAESAVDDLDVVG